jgi:predicted O-methyltransferase YrrM
LQIAEFGVGRGGSAVVLAWLVNHYGGTLTLYDIFGCIPSPGEKDGDQAQKRYQFILNSESKEYYGNVSNLSDTIKQELNNVCDLDQVEFVPGKYEDTLPIQQQARAFDFVHIDCDWYESSKTVLAYLRNNLNSKAMIQVDDYSNWQGSQLATDETEWLHDCRKWLVDGALVVDTFI